MLKKLLIFSFLFSTSIFFAQEAYYNDVDLTKTGIDLKDALAVKITATHTNSLSYTPGVWEASKNTDENPDNSSEVLLIYGYSASGTTARTRSKNSNGGNQGDWNREHTYAKSRGNPNLGTSGPGSDAHHIRPSDVGYNGQRGSLKFNTGSGNSGSVSGGWYPGDEWKGDVARMMMYMYLRYGNRCLPTNIGVGSSAATPDDMIDLFLQWNVDDPVSDFERQRNTYHENTSNNYAQGNRNPFIDNAYLATRIWGGSDAVDTWGIYTSNDNEAPTVPTNLALSNITTSSIDVSWTASTDNESVASYDVFIDGTFSVNTANTTITVSDLTPNTAYAFTVLAKDVANNLSAQSAAVNGTTLQDSQAPSIPTNISVSGETGTAFNLSWTASTDNTAVANYEVYIDGTLNTSTANTTLAITGLANSTTYAVTILAKDTAGNSSAQSAAVNATTTDGSNDASELFISEYVEGSSNNKAIEIANITSAAIDLSIYSIKKQSNGAGNWVNQLDLSGTIAAGDVFVVIHFQADNNTLLAEADLVAPEGSNYGAPINFNGNDPIGLFKNDVLIDIVGVLGETAKNFENMTLRRKYSVTAPNTTYDANEWDQYDVNTVDGIGSHSTLSIEDNRINSVKMYPNPVTGNTLFFKTEENLTIRVYSVLGKQVATKKITTDTNSINLSKLSKGIYLIKISSKEKSITKKLIKR